ncbi:MAG: hypothetical protein Q9174_006315 [Haloplaca sp. 1 TL-2023]
MVFIKASLAASLLALAPLATAHVLLETPVPYGAKTLNTNPLLEDGSDYPCKQREGVYEVSKVNVMPIGQPQTISFKGQATHGGGTCQVSLTTDTPPTKDSVFRVIKTIEGGCPSTNPGNVGDDPFGHGADKFQFSIPNGIPTDKNYTMAWTWFNKIGNREMYMNCAPITVPSGSQRRSIEDDILEERDMNMMNSLPVMFRANIGAMGNGCKTDKSGTVLGMPKANMGKNVQRIGSEELHAPIGNCGGVYGAARAAVEPEAAPQAAPEAAPEAAPQAAPAPQAASEPAPKSEPEPAPESGPQYIYPDSDTPSASEEPAAPAPTTMVPVPSAPAPQASTAASPPATSSAAAPPAPSAAASTPEQPASPAPIPGLKTGSCSTPGKSVCSPDGQSWGTCDEQKHVIFQKVAEGTKCDPALGVLVHTRRSRVYRRGHTFRSHA